MYFQTLIASLNKIADAINNPITFWLQVASSIFLLGTVIVGYRSLDVGRRSLEEARKKRYLDDLPILRVLDAGRRPNPKQEKDFEGDPGAQGAEQKAVIQKHKEHYYLDIENIFNHPASIAFVKTISLWVGSADKLYEIKLTDYHFKNILFSGEKDEIIYDDATPPPGFDDKFVISPKKIEITYQDRWGYVVHYKAERRSRIVPHGLPFLSVADYFFHNYDIDKRLS